MYTSFQSHLQNELQAIEQAGLYKNERIIVSPQGAVIRVADGQEVLNFCANNYLGLSNSPELKQAAKDAIDSHGYGVSSVRFICGTQDVHKQLESAIAQFFGTEDTILYAACFDANGGVFEPLLTEQDAIISDALNHASIIDGVRLCKAQRYRYANADMADLEAQLQKAQAQRFRLIVTDGVFSMDGNVAPLDKIYALAERLAAGPDAEHLLEAGLLKPAEDGKPMRLPWWGDVVLFACRDAEAWPVYLVGRRMDWQAGDRWGKYINQPTAAGAVRWPFNLPAMYAAARRLPNWPWTPAKDRAGDLLLVEGPTDALGAAVLGWAAVALLTRPQAAGPEDRRSGACKMLEAHLPALRSLRLVRVVPDADPGPKGAEGEALAAKLVAWLRAAGCRAEVSTLPDLLPDLLPECKDLADAAHKLKGCLP